MKDAELGDRLMAALADLGLIADELAIDDAWRLIDEATLEVFWRDWPQLRDWADGLWRQLNDDLAAPATPAEDADLDETGGGD